MILEQFFELGAVGGLGLGLYLLGYGIGLHHGGNHNRPPDPPHTGWRKP